MTFFLQFSRRCQHFFPQHFVFPVRKLKITTVLIPSVAVPFIHSFSLRFLYSKKRRVYGMQMTVRLAPTPRGFLIKNCSWFLLHVFIYYLFTISRTPVIGQATPWTVGVSSPSPQHPNQPSSPSLFLSVENRWRLLAGWSGPSVEPNPHLILSYCWRYPYGMQTFIFVYPCG